MIPYTEYKSFEISLFFFNSGNYLNLSISPKVFTTPSSCFWRETYGEVSSVFC